MFPKPSGRRGDLADKDYEDFVRGLPCVVCERGEHEQATRTVPHHHPPGRPRAPSCHTIPLCAEHHTGNTGIHMLGVHLFEKMHALDMWRVIGSTFKQWWEQ